MFSSLKTVTILALLLASLLSPLPAQANGQTRLYLQNVPLQDERLLVVNVLLADVVDLYGVELQLRYDPAQLRVQDDNPRLEGIQIAPGPLLAFDGRLVTTNSVDTESGLINFVFTLLNPAPPIGGEGVLATIVFELSGAGPFSVEVVEAQLVSSNLQPIPVTTEDLRVNDNPTLFAVAQRFVSNLPAQVWWSAALLGAALIALFLVVWLRQRGAGRTMPAAAPASARSMPGAARFSARSSALLTRQGNHILNRGNIEAAYELFSRAVELDPANADAWLGKGLVAQQETEKRICFQRVLALDPDNQTARDELQQLEGRE